MKALTTGALRTVGGTAIVEELARRKGIEHIKTTEELACDGVFDTDQEIDGFLVFVTEQRHATSPSVMSYAVLDTDVASLASAVVCRPR